MRAQTSSYVVSTKICLPESIAKRLEKSFRISNSAYNEALSFGLRRFEALKRNSYYQELLDERRRALKGKDVLKKAKKTTKGLTQQVKCYDKALFDLRKAYSLTEFGLSAHLSQQRRKPCSPYKQFNSGEIQVIAHQAYQTLEKVLFYRIKPHKVRFRSKFDLDVSFRNRVNTTGTRLELSDRKGIAYRLYIHKASTFIDIPTKAFNKHQQMSLLRSEKNQICPNHSKNHSRKKGLLPTDCLSRISTIKGNKRERSGWNRPGHFNGCLCVTKRSCFS